MNDHEKLVKTTFVFVEAITRWGEGRIRTPDPDLEVELKALHDLANQALADMDRAKKEKGETDEKRGE